MKIKRVQTSNTDINQLQTNVATAVEPLFSNNSGIFQVTLTGCTVPVIGIAKWQKAPASGQVTLSLPVLQGTSSSTGATLTGLPATIWPANKPSAGYPANYIERQSVIMPIVNNGSVGVYAALVAGNGVIVLTTDLTSSTTMTGGGLVPNAAFAASGTKGIYACTITYQTAV